MAQIRVAGSVTVEKNNGSGGLGRLLKIKPGEGVTVLVLAGVMLATQAGYWLGGNGIDALVFSRFGSGSLPVLLIVRGLLVFLAIALYSFWLARLDKTLLLTVTSLSVVGVLIGSRIVLELNPPDWFYFLLWPVSYIIPDLLTMQVWALAGQIFDSRQSKRLVPLITAGDTIGAVSGNFLTFLLTGFIGGAKNLLLIWAALCFLAFIGMLKLRRDLDRTERPARKRTHREENNRAGIWSGVKLGYSIVRYYRLIWLLAITTVLSTMLAYVLWLAFVDVSTASFKSNPDQLAAFWGLFAGGSMLVAFLLSLFVVSRLFTRFGVRNFVMVTATVNVIGFAIIVLGFNFSSVLIFRFIQIIALQAFTASAVQTLYNLVPSEARETAQAFNQGVSRQIGMAGAGFVLLLISFIGLSPVLLISLGLAIAYLLVTLRIRALYRPSLVQLLREGVQEFFSPGETNEPSRFGRNEPNTNEALHVAISGLNDPSEGTRRLSAEVLGKMAMPEAVAPLIKALLVDTSAEVRRNCIVALSHLDAPDALPQIAESLDDADPAVRAEAAAALRVTNAGIDPISLYFLRKALNDANPTVRREAVLTMYEVGVSQDALPVLFEMGRAAEPSLRREAALGYQQLGLPETTQELIWLLGDDEPGVRKQAATALGHFNSPTAIAALLGSLEDDNAAVRHEAALSLARLHHNSGSRLVNYVLNTSSPTAQTMALTALTAARLPKATATDAALEDEQAYPSTNLDTTSDTHAAPDYGMAARTDRLTLSAGDEEKLLQYGYNQLDYAKRMLSYQRSLELLDLSKPGKPSPVSRDPFNLSLLQKSLAERYDGAIARLVAVIGLLGNVEAVSLAAAGLKVQTHRANKARADAIETLENFGDSRLTPELVRLLEAEDKGTPQHQGRSLSETLVEIWLEKDIWLQAAVLHVIGLFNLRKLRALVEEVLLTGSGRDVLLDEVATETLQRLDFPRNDAELEKLMLERDMQTLGTLSTMSRILFLQKVPLFASLSPEDLRRVALVTKERLFAPGEIICYEGDPGEELYIIVSGRVQVIAGYGGLTASGGGNGRILRTAGEGEALGEIAILDDIPRSATLRVHGGPARLLTLGEKDFKRILSERPELSVELIRLLSRWLRETNRRLQDSEEF